MKKIPLECIAGLTTEITRGDLPVGAGCETPAFKVPIQVMKEPETFGRESYPPRLYPPRNVTECPITPNIDFIFVRRLKEKQSDTIIKPDQYQQDSDKAVILAVGPGRVVGNQLVPIEWEVGDVVDITKYGIKRESGEYIRCGDVYGKVDEHSAT